ncbi:uncharacterized protein LY89DRAFT_737655 [Mollisia scopiformis]|uniref:Uncharacterized protein n=1 Tax=Mollisia scopiformis TaxID=149040 RepID=A0A194WYR1_MOLSC|nr:uncharacterized protein LY89DRAFT_737655 [Mollisia scopiformis]KUJ12737.1 hypothetical protein LY89DRAFT_737655 [Mollisia scopiformis]
MAKPNPTGYRSSSVARWLELVPLSCPDWQAQHQASSTPDSWALGIMASGSVGDPWDWSVDRIVQELCNPEKRSWTPRSRNLTVGDPVLMERIIREQEVDGSTLLTNVNHDFLEKHGVKALGRRVFVLDAVDKFRQLSAEYQKLTTEIPTRIRESAELVSAALLPLQQALFGLEAGPTGSLIQPAPQRNHNLRTPTEIFDTYSDAELRQLLAAQPSSKLEQLKAAIEAAQLDGPLASQNQLSRGPPSTQMGPPERPNVIEDANQTSQDTTLVPEEPSSKRQKLDDTFAGTALHDEEIAHGLEFTATDREEDLLREARDETPKSGLNPEPASPSSSNKRKRSNSPAEQEPLANVDNDQQEAPRIAILSTQASKKRVAPSFLGPNSAQRTADYEKAKAEDLALRGASSDQTAVSTSVIQDASEVEIGIELAQASSQHSHIEPDSTPIQEDGDDSHDISQEVEASHDRAEEQVVGALARSEHSQMNQQHPTRQQVHLNNLSTIVTGDKENRPSSSGTNQRQELVSKKIARSFYLPKTKLHVDDIFYEGTAVGEDLTNPEASTEIMMLPCNVPPSHRTYVHRCMKSFLRYKPQEFENATEQFTVVRPYRDSLLDASVTVLRPEPSCTVFYTDDEGEVHAERGLVPAIKELEKRERAERASRRMSSRLYGWPGPASGKDLPFETTYRGLMKPKSVRKGQGDAKFFAGSFEALDPDEYYDKLAEKYEVAPEKDKLLAVYGESDSEDDYDEQTWKEICQEAGEEAMKTVRQLRKQTQKSILPEEINRVIDDALAVFKSRWESKKLPKLQRKAWYLWTKARKEGSKNEQILLEQRDLDHDSNRLEEWRKDFMSQSWSSKSELRRVCGALEHTVFGINKTRWMISTLQAKTAPAKPDKNSSLRERKQQSTSDEEGEAINSDSEGEDLDDSEEDLSDFVVSDEEDLPDADVEDEQDQEQQAGILAHPSPDRSSPEYSTSPVADPDTPSKSLQASIEAPRASGRRRLADDIFSSPPNDMSTPIKIRMSTPSRSKDTSDLFEDHIDLTMTSPSVIDLVTPEKSEVDAKLKKSQVYKKSRSTPTLKLRNPDSPFRNSRSDTPVLGNNTMPDLDNLPPFDDPAAINRYSHAVWTKLLDADRLLIKVFFNMAPAPRAKLFRYIATHGFSEKSQNKFLTRMKKVVNAMNTGMSSVASMEQDDFDIFTRFIELFHIFIKGHNGVYEPLSPFPSKEERLKMLVNVLDGAEKFFFSFWKLCSKMEEFFSSYQQTSAPTTPSQPPRHEKIKELLYSSEIEEDDDLPRSSVKRRRDTTMSTSEALESEVSSRLKRKKKVHEDVSARDRREADKARQSQQEERRKNLQERLVRSGRTEDLDLARLVINATDDQDSSIRVHSHIAGSIKPHQIEGVRFLWNQIVTVGEEESMQGCLLAHTMGLGKTMQTITLLVAIAEAASSIKESISSQIPKSLQVSKTLILCPPSVLDNWLDEILTWAPQDILGEIRKVDTSIQMPERLQVIADWYEDGGILLMGYRMHSLIMENKKKTIEAEDHEMVKRHLTEGPNIVVADEAHMLKNSEAGVTKAAQEFRTKSRIALTGSPLANKLEEYYAMINFVAPGYLGPSTEFKYKYVDPIELGLYEDSSNSERRRSLKMLKVLNEDLAAKINRADMSVLKHDLPPKKEFVITVPLTELQKKAYTLYVRSMLQGNAYSTTKSGDIAQTTIWHWLAILSLLCNHPACFKAKLLERKEDARKTLISVNGNSDLGDGIEADAVDVNAPLWKVGVSANLIAEEMGLFEKEVPEIDSIDLSYKVTIMCQILDAAKAAGDKTLVFSESIPTLDYLTNLCKKQGRNYARLDGKTKMGRRQQMTKDFNQGATDVYLISTGAGGLGLNLQGANRVIIFDFKFNPTKEEQAVGRAYRIGQKKTTYVYRFVTGGTFETSIHNKTVFKMQLASRVIDKRTPVAYAKKSLGDYLYEPKDVPQLDLSEFQGMDPEVLDKILATQGQMSTIRGIVQTDTFERDDNDKLTAEEEKEVKLLQLEAKLRRSDPNKYQEMQRKQNDVKLRRSDPGRYQDVQRPQSETNLRRSNPNNYQRQRQSPAPQVAPYLGTVAGPSISYAYASPYQNQAHRQSNVSANQDHTFGPNSKTSAQGNGTSLVNKETRIIPPLTQVPKVATPIGNSTVTAPGQAPTQTEAQVDAQSLPPASNTTSVVSASGRNSTLKKLVRTDAPGGPSSPILGGSTQREKSQSSPSPVPGVSGRPVHKVTEKKPMVSMQHFLLAAIESIENYPLSHQEAYTKANEIQKFIHAKLAGLRDRMILKRAAYDALKNDPQSCRQIVTSELSVEDFIRPLMSFLDQPAPSSSSSNGQIENEQVCVPDSSSLSPELQHSSSTAEVLKSQIEVNKDSASTITGPQSPSNVQIPNQASSSSHETRIQYPSELDFDSWETSALRTYLKGHLGGVKGTREDLLALCKDWEQGELTERAQQNHHSKQVSVDAGARSPISEPLPAKDSLYRQMIKKFIGDP